MSTKDITDGYRLSQWAQVMRERAEKGLSIRAYCDSTGIHKNTYFYWQRKLREAAASGTRATMLEPEEKYLAPAGWATLSVSDEPAHPQSLTVDVGGCRITVYPDTDPELLTKVCRALKSL